MTITDALAEIKRLQRKCPQCNGTGKWTEQIERLGLLQGRCDWCLGCGKTLPCQAVIEIVKRLERDWREIVKRLEAEDDNS